MADNYYIVIDREKVYVSEEVYHHSFARSSPIESFPVLSADIRIWVTVWVSVISAKIGRTF